MKTFTNQAAQGDMMLTRVDRLPEGVKAASPEANNTFIITHSETGHHHVMDSQDMRFYTTDDPLVSYIEVLKETALRHLRTFHTHETISVPVGTYRINRQREFTPSGYRAVAD